ncbi:hypothetical protein FNF28_07471 [Cafeteria roenbergensis]|uniref:Uncharacterized protein n=2 Tax=Cafeteria roenbergensis TaxID=33653 RepID=A0A5A8C5Y0_CAFRO|nr:hypothetical protein FNF28_07471 [Cafeteria roenbergensis]
MSQKLTAAPSEALERGIETDGSALAERVEAALLAAGSPEARNAVLDELLELSDAMTFMAGSGVQRVALQFPDGLLGLASRAVERCSALLAAAGSPGAPAIDVVVLGDTSYGADMVDEVGAKHYDPAAAAANARGLNASDTATHDASAAAVGVVHFGPATLVASASLPVFFALGRAPIDVAAAAAGCAAAAREAAATAGAAQRVWLSCDSDLLHAAADIAAAIRGALGDSWEVVVPPVTRSFRPGEQPGAEVGGEAQQPAPADAAAAAAAPAAAGPDSSGGPMDAAAVAAELVRTRALPAGSDSGCVVHVGAGGEALRRLGLVLGGPPTFTVAAQAGGEGTPCAWEAAGLHPRALTRHFLHAERARLARSVALVAGTMAARGFLPLLRALRKLVRGSGRRCTTLLVGKLNPAKLANFDGVDVFVVVGSGDGSLLDASAQKEFSHPVLSAHELIMGVLPDEVPWEGRLVSDVEGLLRILRRAAPQCLDDAPPADAEPANAGADDAAAQADAEAAALDDDSDAPFFSPLTGKFHGKGAPDEHAAMHAESGGALVPAAERALTVPGTAASVLAGKEWRGLDPSVPEDAPAVVERGWHGVASSFSHERDRRGGGATKKP